MSFQNRTNSYPYGLTPIDKGSKTVNNRVPTPESTNSYPYGLTPIDKGSKTVNNRVPTPESLPIHLNYHKTLNIGTPRLTTVAVFSIKQYDFTMQQCLQKMKTEWQTV